MPEKQPDLWAMIVQSGPAVGLSMFGAFAEMMAFARKIDVRFILGTLCAGAFVGLIINFLLTDQNFPDSLKAALIGMSGASARGLMLLFRKWILSWTERKMKL